MDDDPKIPRPGRDDRRPRRRALTRGRDHRRRLADIDVRIAVTGTRGKSSMVTWLHEAFVARGYDTYAKVTGEEPHSLYNGTLHPIERSGPVKLYETAAELRRFVPVDVLVVENQGIREYTTRLVNEDYVEPTLVVLTNVRRDHLDTLGEGYLGIARSLARSVPPGVQVVTGERNPEVLAYLERELARRDATLVRAVGPEVPLDPAAEQVALLEAALVLAGVTPLTTAEREAFAGRFEMAWARVPGGRVFDAANVNDVESTELVRRALQGDTPEVFQPVVYLRADRPGRTATYVQYLNWLAEAGLVEQVRVVGAHRDVLTRRLRVPVVAHDERIESAAEVLDAALADGWPVVLMGNAVPPFAQALRREVATRRHPVVVECEAETGEPVPADD
ncbi:Mur ligase family protein [Salinirubellus salinus]